MKYHYIGEDKVVRYFKWNGRNDVRGHVPPKGWIANAMLVDIHPISGKQLKNSEWWIEEVKELERV